MDEDYSNTSEWNEQMLFASLFFEITRTCRSFQIQENPMGWLRSLEAKMVLVSGVADDKEIPIVRKKREELNDVAWDCNKDKKFQELYGKLFDVEIAIDRIAHKHMPFLKLQREVDINTL